MKKTLLYFACFIVIVLFSGCSMENTPTKRVENFLDNYKSQNDTVLNQLQEMVSSDTIMDENQRSRYSDIMKRQYKDMTYEIKDETIQGNNATVIAEIEVYDYYKTNKEAEEYYNNNPNEFANDTNNNDGLVEKAKDAVDEAKEEATSSNNFKLIEYRLNSLNDTKDRVKYTINFSLTKKDDKWTLNDIDDATRQKIHGLYEH